MKKTKKSAFILSFSFVLIATLLFSLPSYDKIAYADDQKDKQVSEETITDTVDELLENTEIIPIFYGDGCSEEILKASGYSGHSAFRNGSVSGTAAYFSLSITSGKIFYCGLDLSFSKGFSHTQPNELEKRNSIFDNRTHTSETRNFSSEINTVSINIYKNWFSSNDFFGRIFRLSDNFKYDSELGKIKDVNGN